ncbi:MAG: hypothetical protein GX238_07230 [Epulopiscium sp.]|nr:hypothetical protein [Candidatus Epulonipiscium sp.]
MFWTGIIVGIFIGAILGILIVSMAISATDSYKKENNLVTYEMEASQELVPEIDDDEQERATKEEEE